MKCFSQTCKIAQENNSKQTNNTLQNSKNTIKLYVYVLCGVPTCRARLLNYLKFKIAWARRSKAESGAHTLNLSTVLANSRTRASWLRKPGSPAHLPSFGDISTSFWFSIVSLALDCPFLFSVIVWLLLTFVWKKHKNENIQTVREKTHIV